MKCVAEARDGRTKDVQVFRAHLRDNQSLSRSPWERLEAVNLSQFIRFHWAWSLAELRGNEASWFLVRGAENSRDYRQGSQFSLQNCPFLGASSASLASPLHCWLVRPAMPIMPGYAELCASVLSPLDCFLSASAGLVQPFIEMCVVHVADFCFW